jgi:hypothetical protein
MNNKLNISSNKAIKPLFGPNFIEDHARNLITNPKIALVELIANCWDAGANRVDITWPLESRPELIIIQDDGTGMTSEEFLVRWFSFNYNRKEKQGTQVIFPDDNQKSNRTAFGRNGKGRHSMFCFSNKYTVKTWRENSTTAYEIERTQGTSDLPYKAIPIEVPEENGHGTKLSAELTRGSYINIEDVKDLIGSKFVVDPFFHIFVNGEAVKMMDLRGLVIEKIKLDGIGTINISFIGTERGRTSKQHGVAWWVNNRLVGEPSWQDFDEHRYLDARTSGGKSFTFIVQADLLIDEVKDDWSGFKPSETFNAVRNAVSQHISDKLKELLKDIHKANKISILEENKKTIKRLPISSRYQIGRYIDQVQEKMPTIQRSILSNTVAVLSKLEEARTGHALLEQLAKLNVSDLDTLSDILSAWSVQEAMVVLDELRRRIDLIQSLENLTENPRTDELHELHPLFDKGLWMFGPEYESLQYMSNRSLTTVINNLLNKKGIKTDYSNKRPDIVALPDATLSVHSLDHFENAEVNGCEKVLILELKRGGFRITKDEIRQVDDYATEIRKSGKVESTTIITGFVLGTTIAPEAQEKLTIGKFTEIIPWTFSTVLRSAHARTFHLMKKIKELKQEELSDPEVERIMAEPEQLSFSGSQNTK